MAKPNLELHRSIMAHLPDSSGFAIPARLIAERLDIHSAIVGTALRSLVNNNFVLSIIRRDLKPSRRADLKARRKWVHEKKKHYWKIKEIEDVVKP